MNHKQYGAARKCGNLGELEGVRQAILDLLRTRDMLAGDSINIILAQYELERKGIDRNAFSAGVVQLLDCGWLDMHGNVFYLTAMGYEALKRDKERGT